MTAVRSTCPCCGYAEDAEEYICRRCGFYFGDRSAPAPAYAPPPRAHPRSERAIALSLREPDGRYEAVRIPEVATHPGGAVRLIARVTNDGTIVEGVTVDVEGVPREWVEIRRPDLHLLPFRRGGDGYEGEVELCITFPASPEADTRGNGTFGSLRIRWAAIAGWRPRTRSSPSAGTPSSHSSCGRRCCGPGGGRAANCGWSTRATPPQTSS